MDTPNISLALSVIATTITMIATTITVYNTLLFLRQSKPVEKQTLIQRTEIYPLLKVQTMNVNDDIFTITLKNMTEAPAFSLGLLIHFTPCYFKEKRWEFIENIRPLNDEIKVGYPLTQVILLKDAEGHSRLGAEEEGTFQARTYFSFGDSLENPSVWVTDTYDKLRSRLMLHQIRFVAIGVSVVYKDLPETIEELEPLGAYICDLERHFSFGEAWNEKVSLNQRTVDFEDLPHITYSI